MVLDLLVVNSTAAELLPSNKPPLACAIQVSSYKTLDVSGAISQTAALSSIHRCQVCHTFFPGLMISIFPLIFSNRGSRVQIILSKPASSRSDNNADSIISPSRANAGGKSTSCIPPPVINSQINRRIVSINAYYSSH